VQVIAVDHCQPINITKFSEHNITSIKVDTMIHQESLVHLCGYPITKFCYGIPITKFVLKQINLNNEQGNTILHTIYYDITEYGQD